MENVDLDRSYVETQTPPWVSSLSGAAFVVTDSYRLPILPLRPVVDQRQSAPSCIAKQ